MISTEIRNPLMACLAALIIVTAPAMGAAPASPGSPAPAAETPRPTSEVLDQLDEVVVHGKHLKDEIIKAEDEYFSLFNDVNKDDRYDTHCVYLQMSQDSRLQNRACIPGFVADAMADWAPYKARCQPPMDNKYGPGGAEFSCLDRNNDGKLSLDEASAREELAAVFDEIAGDDGRISPDEFQDAMNTRTDLSAPAIYMPPTPDAVLVNGTKKWYDHMTEVTNSDPRLHKMADHLGDLYHELAVTQQQFDKLDAESKPKVARPSLGPRASSGR